MIWADMLRIGNLAVKIGFYLTMKVTKIRILGEVWERAAVHGGGQFGVRGWAIWGTGVGNGAGAGRRGRQKNNAAAAREWATTAVWAVSMLQLCSK